MGHAETHRQVASGNAADQDPGRACEVAGVLGNRAARPTGYASRRWAKTKNPRSRNTLASSTMIVTGTIVCKECRERYPIEDGIPNMLPPDQRG